MKKIVLFTILSFLILTGCSSSKLNNISLNELKEKISNKETFIVYFNSNDNNSLREKLESIQDDYKLDIYEINSSKITSDQKNSFESVISYEDGSIVFIINGLDPSKLSHITNKDITKNQIIERLKDMKFIKE